MPQAPDIFTEYAGWMKARIILTAAELDTFTLLDGEPLTAEELAVKLKADARAVARILDCLVVFELLQKSSRRYALTGKGAFFSSRHPESVLPMLLHMNNMWDNWSRLTQTVREGKNPNLNSVINAKDEAVTRAFIGAMHVIGKSMSQKIAASYNAGSFKRLLDIGGGSGTYTIAFLEQNKYLHAVIFDLPDVIALAAERLKAQGYLERVSLVAGDFYKDELPKGCDLALLSAIIHQNSPQENLALYRKIYQALEPGGAVLIRDHIMDESRTRPPAGALFAINMLVHTTGGDTYTFKEIKEMLEQAGFQDVLLARSGERMDCLVEGRKPL
jgi:ubiquinone/menaquinone biosynthesis C-methylase UbiE/predicted transcriptional regulator